MNLNKILLKNKKTEEIAGRVNNNKNVKILGLDNSRLSFFAGNIMPELENRVLLITPDSYRVDRIYEDLMRLIPEKYIMIFPEIEVLPHEQIIPDLMVMRDRIRVLQDLCFNNRAKVIITTPGAIMRKLMPVQYFQKYSLSFSVGQEIKLNNLSESLTILGYSREEMVEEPGDFSIRGGIIDIFTITDDKPYRLELFGDEIDSIREFDPSTQRSVKKVGDIFIPPVREIILLPDNIQQKLPEIKADYREAIKNLKNIGKKEEADYLKEKSKEAIEKLSELNEFPGYEQFLPYFFEELHTIFNYAGEQTTLFFDNSEKVLSRIKSFSRDIQETEATLLEQGSIILSYAENFPTTDEFLHIVNNHNHVYCDNEFQNSLLQKKQEIKEYRFKTQGVEPYHGQLELFTERIEDLIAKGYGIVITLNNENKVSRIGSYLQERDLPVVYSLDNSIKRKVFITAGSFSEGFIFEDIDLVVYTEKEVIGNPQKKKRKMQVMEEGVEISSLNELSVGDYVVHENHGIGKYLGVKTLEVQSQHQDYLVLKYADEDKLYVPTDKINLVQKYIGTDSKPPKLYNLGSNEWQRVKQKVKKSVKEMAIGLLELYAEREMVEGYAFSEDTVWQKEFEESFAYEETPDQLQAIKDVKADMEESTPMDRLLCGDVGYGKTEVAIRAAFKAAVDGKQTAVLVPTTILAQQHYNTFQERIYKYPINIEMISRFKTRKEQKEILKELAKGNVDIVIGTHRLLSSDVVFNDLGLLIIDEEQRFGVSHKEKLKDIKKNVDVLTLSATPIPRTLHMALVGVRDMSVIETPPENRYPIRTYIREFDRDLIKETIRREIGRDGQVYFVHNRVEDIQEKADMIRKLLPEARVAVGHGQMNENQLERLMYDFYRQEYDVLVCTTIIETGLDIPNVNTIIINRADQMGLAQLYQLRGRVGRSNRIAYAYLLYEKDRILPEVAEKRLKAIKEFTNLGSGFKIAMRDLEIRGAGNLLGAEQHGHIASIGFSLYCKLLEGAIEELKGEKGEQYEIELDFHEDAYIPDKYISDPKQKIEIYKKIKGITSEEEVEDVLNQIIDRFGDPPDVVLNLIDVSRIRIKARKLGIDKVKQKDDMINCYFRNMNQIEGSKIIKLVDEFPRKIKVKSARKPVLGIRINGEPPLKFVYRVLNHLLKIVTSN